MPKNFDYAATTPVDSYVLEQMMPWFQKQFGNSVSNHQYGWEAESGVEKARGQVRQLLNALNYDIYFTSGATESNNWVIQSMISKTLDIEKKPSIHIISSPTEHSSVLKTLKYFEKIGRAQVSWVPADRFGQVQPEDLKKSIRPETKLISLMWANNEIGSLNPVDEILQLARENQIYFHSDATQALGKTPLDLEKTPVDLISVASHKVYGPKGVGALLVRKKNPRVDLPPFMLGGSHESGQRAGTLNVAGIVGFGAACELLSKNMVYEIESIKNLSQYLCEQIKQNFPLSEFNGHPTSKIPHVISVTFNGSQVPAMLMGVCVSKGSACNSGGESISPVLQSIGLSEKAAEQTLRISLGRFTTKEDIDSLIESLKKNIR